MDFRKIEYFLIIAFLMLDMFLLYVFVGKNTTLLTASQAQANVNIMEEIKKKNVTLKFKGDDSNQNLPMVAAKKDTFKASEIDQSALDRWQLENNDTRLFAQLRKPVALTLDQKDPNALSDKDQEVLQKMLTSGIIINGNDYAFSYYDAGQGVIYCDQVIHGDDNYGIQDSSAQLLLHVDQNHQIVSFEQTHISQAKKQGDARNLVSQQRAIESLYLSNQIPQDGTIYRATLSYQSTLAVDDIIVYRPVWQVLLAGDDHALMIEFVDGINGNTIQSSNAMTAQSMTSATQSSQTANTDTSATSQQKQDSQQTEGEQVSLSLSNDRINQLETAPRKGVNQ
ncbi:MAG: two-component system regulatory protein YycI [Aerococcus sp.]|nr:two-component system regulatory protein YycI [Aerococcus sp.]